MLPRDRIGRLRVRPQDVAMGSMDQSGTAQRPRAVERIGPVVFLIEEEPVQVEDSRFGLSTMACGRFLAM
jgi:hypothetical protein